MIDVAEAKRRLLEGAAVLDVVEVPLSEAHGRVLAEPAQADRDLPAGDVSTMDGFALRSADARNPGAVLRIAGEVRAGQAPPAEALAAGSATRIYTGALIPPGADTVVMVERTRERAGEAVVEILDAIPSGENIRRHGEDVRRGDEVAAAHARIRAPEAAALAGIGRLRVPVFRRPRVRIVSTGDELVPPEATPLAHQVRNSNARALVSQLAELGITAIDLGVAQDDPATLAQLLRTGLEGDLLLVTGGVSAGRYDLVKDVLQSLGMQVLFHGVAVRPGKPLLAGRCGACLVVGLPGNPVSAFTGFSIFVAPAIRKMEGLREVDLPALTARLAAPLPARPGRTTYHLARVDVEDGLLVARPVRSRGSGDFLALVRANAFLVTAADARPLDEGAPVTVEMFAPLGRPA